jgi:pimeloyl-ACP methyl ester carboxylesterase
MSSRLRQFLLPAFYSLLITILLAACSAPPATPNDGGGIPDGTTNDTGSADDGGETIEQPEASDAFEITDCPYESPDNLDIECGFVTVPENRTKEGSPDINLMVAVVRAENPTADSVVYLAGGPGSSGLDEFFQDVEGWEAYGFFGERDVIFVDQRGTGFSEPTLNCPELENVDYESGEDPEGDATRACHDRLVEEGIDLTAYNTTENAADIDAIREALGYDQWNLLGISYGTRLALTIMRNHPEGVRAAIIDGVYPLDVDAAAEEAPNLWTSLQAMMAGCAADPACNEAYPDLENVLIETVGNLNENPADYSAIDFETGDESDATLTGDDLLNGLSQAMYDSSSIPLLPRVIYDVSDGDFESYALLAGSLGFARPQSRPRQDDEDVSDSEGMNTSVECHDEYAFATIEDAEAAVESVPEELQSGLFGAASWLDTCEWWGAGEADPSLNEPVTSDIPTLVLSGEFDPVTPPAWGEMAASHLTTHYAYTVHGGGHAVSAFDECVVHVVNQFLDDPTVEPDATCVQDIAAPAWIMPDDPLDMFEE